MGNYVNDFIKLKLIAPYLVSLFEDPLQESSDPVVISASFSAFCDLLSKMKEPFQTKIDCKLFKDFIWENITQIAQSPNILVQATFAEKFHLISDFCQLFLIQSFSISITNFLPEENKLYSAELNFLKISFIQYIRDILNKNLSNQEILLGNLQYLLNCDLFDVEICQNEILTLIISGFNKSKDLKQVNAKYIYL